MRKQRRSFTGMEKVALLRQHVLGCLQEFSRTLLKFDKENGMRSSLFTPYLRPLLTIFASAVGLFLMHAAYNCIWLYSMGPQPEQAPPIRFGNCQVMSSALIACQLPVLLLGAIAAVVLRGHYRMGVGLLAGLLLFFLTMIAPIVHLYTSTTLGIIVYSVVFPLVVSALQWLPEGRNGDDDSIRVRLARVSE